MFRTQAPERVVEPENVDQQSCQVCFRGDENTLNHYPTTTIILDPSTVKPGLKSVPPQFI